MFVPGLTQREAEMRLLKESPVPAAPGRSPSPGPSPARCRRHLAAGCVLRLGVPVPCGVGEGRRPAPPAPPSRRALSRAAVNAPINIFIPPFLLGVHVYIDWLGGGVGGVGGGAVSGAVTGLSAFS